MRGLLGNASPFDIGSDEGESPASMLAALKDGRIDVLITWQPAIGAFLRDYPALDVVTVPNERALGPPEQLPQTPTLSLEVGSARWTSTGCRCGRGAPQRWPAGAAAVPTSDASPPGPPSG